ncbi:MAG: hypothetical protein JST28_17090 [Acidobacteria bacterium]|nr:hypothetical protein [Acidobacteriota bacterium]
MIKKQLLLALLLLLLIPAVMLAGGLLFSLINPEIAAGHPNYTRNWHLLSQLKGLIMFGMFATVLALYLLGSFLVIRSKSQSSLWLLLAALGPLGFAILSVLNDRAPSESDRYSRFLCSMKWYLRISYELLCLYLVWELSWQIMILKRNLTIRYESITTGVSTAQIIATQNASSGMWAFGESLQVMFFIIILYLLRPILFNLIARLVSSKPLPATT